MSDLDEKTLLSLTKLSRIDCTEEEQKKLLKNLTSVLSYIDQLQSVDTKDAPVCNHVLESINNVMREDEVKETLETSEFIENSPSHLGGMIRVPPVIKF